VGLPAETEQSNGAKTGFRRHRPELTVLYQTVERYWPEFRERAEEQGGLPKFVVKEFEAYLRCGRLEAGCLHLVCQSCGHSQLVAFSCKKRGFCCSCLGRRMTDTAVHLCERVLPAVPIRQWVCSLPWRLRFLCGYDRTLCSEVLAAFVGELSRSLRWRAKRLLDLDRVVCENKIELKSSGHAPAAGALASAESLPVRTLGTWPTASRCRSSLPR